MRRFFLIVLVMLLSALPVLPQQVASKDPVLVAHRGLLRQAPENTLCAFGACMDLRMGLELDIRRSKDGHPVCMHDEDVKRTTNGSGLVKDLSLAALKKLDAGAWFNLSFAGERIPTLDQVFAMLKERKAKQTLVALDLKIDDNTVVEDIVRLAENHGVVEQMLCIGLSISDAKLRRRYRVANPKMQIAMLVNSPKEIERALSDKDVDWLYIRFVPSSAQVASIHATGKRVILVGPLVAGHEPENWRRGREAGVDAILTDYPLDCRQGWRQPKTP